MQEFILFFIFGFVVATCLVVSYINRIKKEPKYKPQVIRYNGKNAEFFKVLNEYRQSKGLNLLQGEYLLSNLANSHANYMSYENICSHYNYAYRELLSKSDNYDEIVAVNFKTAKDYLNGYLRSKAHKKIIDSNEYTHVGISEINGFQCVNFATY